MLVLSSKACADWVRLQRYNAWHALSTPYVLDILAIPLTPSSRLTHDFLLIFPTSGFIKGSKHNCSGDARMKDMRQKECSQLTLSPLCCSGAYLTLCWWPSEPWSLLRDTVKQVAGYGSGLAQGCSSSWSLAKRIIYYSSYFSLFFYFVWWAFVFRREK